MQLLAVEADRLAGEQPVRRRGAAADGRGRGGLDAARARLTQGVRHRGGEAVDVLRPVVSQEHIQRTTLGLSSQT